MGAEIIAVDCRTNGNFREFRHGGFSDQEEIGTWGLGIESWMELPRPKVGGAITLAATVMPCLEHKRVLSQGLEIQAGGVAVYHGVIANWTEIRVKLPAEQVACRN
jgi:hypothetical protein